MAEQKDTWDQMLRAANAGDGTAYRQFLQAITPVVRGIVRARSGSLDAALCEDIVQEVLFAVHLKRHTWQQSAPVRPWLYAIARHKIVDAFRARGRRIDLPIDDFADALVAEADTDPTEAGDVARMIGLLEPRAAQIVRKIGLEGATIGETAAALTMQEGAVRVALHRAFRQLAALRERHLK